MTYLTRKRPFSKNFDAFNLIKIFNRGKIEISAHFMQQKLTLKAKNFTLQNFNSTKFSIGIYKYRIHRLKELLYRLLNLRKFLSILS